MENEITKETVKKIKAKIRRRRAEQPKHIVLRDIGCGIVEELEAIRQMNVACDEAEDLLESQI